MNIAFLGTSTDDKRFLLLCLARIMSGQKKVVVLSARHYAFDDDLEEIYDYCGIEIHHIIGEDFLIKAPEEDANYFFDIERYIPLKEGFKAVVICESPRMLLEESVRLAGEYSWINPSLPIEVIYLNLMEYCRVSKKYLDLFWERSVPSFTVLAKAFPIYFEEANRVAMLESQFSDRLSVKGLTSSFKSSLLNIIQSLFDMDRKQAGELIKRAERMR